MYKVYVDHRLICTTLPCMVSLSMARILNSSSAVSHRIRDTPSRARDARFSTFSSYHAQIVRNTYSTRACNKDALGLMGTRVAVIVCETAGISEYRFRCYSAGLHSRQSWRSAMKILGRHIQYSWPNATTSRARRDLRNHSSRTAPVFPRCYMFIASAGSAKATRYC